MRLASFVICLALACPGLAAAQDLQPQIAVQGEGVVAAEPDMAIISMGVTREARTASAAMDGASAATADVLASVKAAGIEPRDVQTSSISLSPNWDHTRSGPPVVNGYVASNQLSVRVRDLAELGGLLDRVVGDGANTMNGLSFAVAEPRPLEDEARTAAVKDARAKAELLAAAAGVTLGPVISIAEAGSFAPPGAMMRTMADESAMAVPVAAGEIEYRISVSVVFGIAGQ